MPSVSEKQARFFAAAAHDPAFAKSAGVSQSVAKDFNRADTGTKLLSSAMHHQPRAAGGIGLSVRASPGIRSGGGGLGSGIPQVAKLMSPSEGEPPWTRSASREASAPIHVGGGIGQRGHFAVGGMMSPSEAEPPWTRSQARQINDVNFHSGLIDSAVPGRTDRLPLAVGVDSHVLPADGVSGAGQSSTKAGSNVWAAAIRSGPWGVEPPKAVKGPGPGSTHAPHLSQAQTGLAAGGRAKTSILAAGGEIVISPDDVEAIGQRGMASPKFLAAAIKDGWSGKDKSPMEFGHWLIDRAIKRVRDFNIKWLQNAPKPKT